MLARLAGNAALATILATGTLAASGTAVAPRPALAPTTKDLVEHGATSAIVLVADGAHSYVATGGKRHPQRSQRFRIGSITKTFTAVLVMQLVQEKKLRLGDTVARYLPGVVPAGRRITIRDLLQHRSGLANFTDYEAWLLRADRSRATTPLATLTFAASKPLLFPPGSLWSYSNTNYVALGLIIEKITGHGYAAELQQRIFTRLGLRHTELPDRRKLPDIHDAGANPNLAWAAGGIVSNAQDLVRFFTALLSGKVVTKGSLRQMEQTVPAANGSPLFDSDGLGLFSAALQCGRFWGHSGSILDSWSVVEASPDGRRVAVIAYRGPDFRVPDMLALLCW
jgi:D-alanyl-D-alanine carboxypeptidase